MAPREQHDQRIQDLTEPKHCHHRLPCANVKSSAVEEETRNPADFFPDLIPASISHKFTPKIKADEMTMKWGCVRRYVSSHVYKTRVIDWLTKQMMLKEVSRRYNKTNGWTAVFLHYTSRTWEHKVRTKDYKELITHIPKLTVLLSQVGFRVLKRHIYNLAKITPPLVSGQKSNSRTWGCVYMCVGGGSRIFVQSHRAQMQSKHGCT